MAAWCTRDYAAEGFTGTCDPEDAGQANFAFRSEDLGSILRRADARGVVHLELPAVPTVTPAFSGFFGGDDFIRASDLDGLSAYRDNAGKTADGDQTATTRAGPTTTTTSVPGASTTTTTSPFAGVGGHDSTDCTHRRACSIVVISAADPARDAIWPYVVSDG